MNAHFMREMVQLNGALLDLAKKAIGMARTAVESVKTSNADVAAHVVADDEIVDDGEIAIEEECLKILALYQPFAGDLRRVVAILKIDNEIERAGDLAVNIAERVYDMAAFERCGVKPFFFDEMAERALDMLKDSVDAFAAGNSVLAEDVLKRDDAVDCIHRRNYSLAKDGIILYPDSSGYYLDCLTVSRCLERIADIATNIAEDVVYLETGKIIRHEHDKK